MFGRCRGQGGEARAPAGQVPRRTESGEAGPRSSGSPPWVWSPFVQGAGGAGVASQWEAWSTTWRGRDPPRLSFVSWGRGFEPGRNDPRAGRSVGSPGRPFGRRRMRRQQLGVQPPPQSKPRAGHCLPQRSNTKGRVSCQPRRVCSTGRKAERPLPGQRGRVKPFSRERVTSAPCANYLTMEPWALRRVAGEKKGEENKTVARRSQTCGWAEAATAELAAIYRPRRGERAFVSAGCAAWEGARTGLLCRARGHGRDGASVPCRGRAGGSRGPGRLHRAQSRVLARGAGRVPEGGSTTLLAIPSSTARVCRHSESGEPLAAGRCAVLAGSRAPKRNSPRDPWGPALGVFRAPSPFPNGCRKRSGEPACKHASLWARTLGESGSVRGLQTAESHPARRPLAHCPDLRHGLRPRTGSALVCVGPPGPFVPGRGSGVPGSLLGNNVVSQGQPARRRSQHISCCSTWRCAKFGPRDRTGWGPKGWAASWAASAGALPTGRGKRVFPSAWHW